MEDPMDGWATLSETTIQEERVRFRDDPDVLGTVMAWLNNAVVVRWDAPPGRSGEYRQMRLNEIVPAIVSDPAEDRAYVAAVRALTPQ